MRLLIVAATAAEIGPLISNFEYPISNIEVNKDFIGSLSFGEGRGEASYLISGVGMVATAYALGTHLAANIYDLVINLGICGSFDRSINLGEVVEVIEDTFAELGAEDDKQFIPLNDLGFGKITFKPNGQPFLNIRQVKGITVNKVHGNEASIQKVVERLNPQVESMEGAAVFYACKQADVACVQIRAVSNYVEKRNRDAWQIGLAVKNLNNVGTELLRLQNDK